MALQRVAGNAAVSALLAARLRSPGDTARADIDGGLREMRRDEPAIEPVERGLRAAQAAGIPVDLEGTKPPASALAVTVTGFGPASVAARGPAAAPKQVPATSPLGKVAAKAPGRGRRRPGAAAAAGGGARQPGGAGARPEGPTTGGGGAEVAAPSPEQLLAPPVAPTAGRPEDDPAFARVTQGITGFAAGKRAHPAGAAKAGEAQGAAVAPAEDLAGQAKAAKVDSMDAQQAGAFDKKAFIAAVKAAIEAKSPTTLKEADDYAESGKAGEIKGELRGLVTSGKQGQAKDVEAATAAPPDQSTAVAKPVTPMAQEQPGPTTVIASPGAVPKAAPPEQTNLAAGKHQADQELADGGVTEAELATSNEPQFEEALSDKRAAAAHADTAPAAYRQHEQGVIEQGRTDAADRHDGGRRRDAGSQGRGDRQARRREGQDEVARTRPSGPRSRRRCSRSSPPPRPTSARSSTASIPRSTPRSSGARPRRGRRSSASSPPRWRPTRRTATAGGWASCAGPRTRCSGCRPRSTSSTSPAASCTSSRWTA